jgi:hypothetical protein
MSKLPWFRLYGRIIEDPKIKLLAFEDRWHFVAILCLKSDGLIDEPDSNLRTRKIAVALGVQVRELDEIGRRLSEVDLVDEHLNPVSWDDLQMKSDTSTARVQKYRKKQQKQAGNKTKRSETVSETVQEKEQNRTDISPNGDCASSDALAPAHIFDEWNLVAEAIGRPKVRDRSPSRVQLVKARIAQYELSDFVAVFGKVRASDFLSGKTDRWQGVTFDWVMKRANFVKILEGNYDG